MTKLCVHCRQDITLLHGNRLVCKGPACVKKARRSRDSARYALNEKIVAYLRKHAPDAYAKIVEAVTRK